MLICLLNPAIVRPPAVGLDNKTNIIAIHIIYILFLLSKIEFSHNIKEFNCSIVVDVLSSEQIFENIPCSFGYAIMNDYLNS